jgi:hypothetical protein
MKELIRRYAARIVDGRGTRYTAAAYGEERSDGTWVAWLEFSPVDVDGPVLRTADETLQGNSSGLDSWASQLDREQLQQTLYKL